ncbi:MAG: PEP-CTERM sorting domain-containing protein [Bryobacterales bacterium]|nr:PEP-CTERM sorting domain-containing protein [Bryobacteraceae bacterium]MDW8353044.1 PEP-CTERM sorting domain-containing protein [Bryobacterales bacterium]
MLDPLSTQLASLGVIFNISGGAALIGGPFVPPASSAVSGRYLMINTCHYLAQTCSGTPAVLTVYFVAPWDSTLPAYVDGSTISFDLWDTNDTPLPRVIVHAYDVAGGHLGTLNLLSEFVNNVTGFTGPVHRLVFVDHGADGHVVDNFRFGALTAVPEPASFLLVGAGLVLAGSYRRRAASSNNRARKLGS